MKIGSDKQTLILKGEPIPPRVNAGDAGLVRRYAVGLQLQRMTMLLAQGNYVASPLVAEGAALFAAVPSVPALPASAVAIALSVPAQSLMSYSSNRARSAGAAEYALTQNRSGASMKSQLIDTYA